MEDLNISATIGMEGIPLASREAAVSRMPSLIEKQAARAVEESSVIIFLVDGQVMSFDRAMLMRKTFPKSQQMKSKTKLTYCFENLQR